MVFSMSFSSRSLHIEEDDLFGFFGIIESDYGELDTFTQEVSGFFFDASEADHFTTYFGKVTVSTTIKIKSSSSR